MELGEKLRQARLEAGLSQRQLCGDVITRNMLSQIEHGTARPSMDTLRYLAAKLGKSVGYFLDEQTLESPNTNIMRRARQCFDGGDFAGVTVALEDFREPDEVFGREKAWMARVAYLALAEQALADGRKRYALELLEQAKAPGFPGESERQRLLLLGKIQTQGLAEICRALPSLDEELMLRARAAMEQGDSARAAALLDAAENQASPEWNLLRGKVYMMADSFAAGAACLHKAEGIAPEVYPLLEQCYRELGDYKLAYEYACRQKK